MGGEPDKEKLLFRFRFFFFFFFWIWYLLTQPHMWVTKLILKYFPWVNKKKRKKTTSHGRDESLCFLHPHFFCFFWPLLSVACELSSVEVPTTTRFDFCEILKKKQGVNGHLCPRLRNVHFERMDPNGQTPQNPVISNKGIRGAAEVRNFKRLFAISNPN